MWKLEQILDSSYLALEFQSWREHNGQRFRLDETVSDKWAMKPAAVKANISLPGKRHLLNGATFRRLHLDGLKAGLLQQSIEIRN